MACASRGSSTAMSSAGRAWTMPAALSPSTRRVAAATAAGRPIWVSTATRRVESGLAGCSAGRSSGLRPHSPATAYSRPSHRCTTAQESVIILDERGQIEVCRRLGSPQQDKELTVAGCPRQPARDRALPAPAVLASGVDHAGLPGVGAPGADHPAAPAARPTSNCGLTSSSTQPSSRVTETSGPISNLSEMKETSATARSTELLRHVRAAGPGD